MISTVPDNKPDTMPDEIPIGAVNISLLTHVPPAGVLVKVVVPVTQIEAAPPKAVGSALTETVVVLRQPVGSV